MYFINSKVFLPKQNPAKPFRSSFRSEFNQKQTLSTQYGPPSNSYPYPPAVSTSNQLPPAVHEIIHETFADDDTTDPTIIAVANANGRYRIFEKENTHDHIVYRNLHDKHHDFHNDFHDDFLSHYHHSHGEPILEDIVYGYDDHGHLVRVY